MKHLLSTFSIIALLFMVIPQYASAQRGGNNPPPDPNNPHLYDRPLNTSGYVGTIIGEMHLYEYTNSSIYGSFEDYGIHTNDIFTINLFTWESHFPGLGGPDNDRAVGVGFTGDCTGVYTFYDSQDGYTSDDYCIIHVLIPIPAGKTYHVSDFEQNYSDDYVYVDYHGVNGLNGKVSSINGHKNQVITP